MSLEYPEYTCIFADVYLAELNYIHQRRRHMGFSQADLQEVESEIQRMSDALTQQKSLMSSSVQQPAVPFQEKPCIELKPSSKVNLVGLAFSGGGIRSAIFNLGVLQSLAQKKILQYCDYLSTVSGGGYIGSCLSSLLAADPNASTQAETFPLCAQRESELEERKEVNHLRKTKNFLGFNQGLFSPDLWCFIGSFLSGLILMNVFPLFALLLMVAVLYLFSAPPITLVANVIILGFIALLFILIVLTRFRQAALFLSSSDEQVRFKQNKRIADRTAWLSFLVFILLLINVIYTWAGNWANLLNSLSFYLVLPLPIIVIAYLIPQKNKFQKKLTNIIMAVALIGLFLLSSALILSYLYQQERAKITADIVDEIPSELEEPINDIIERLGIFSGSKRILATIEKIRIEYALKNRSVAKEKIINPFHEFMNALNYEHQRLNEKIEIDEPLKTAIEELLVLEREQSTTLWLQSQKNAIAKPVADYLEDIEQLITRLYQENLYSLATRWAIMKQEFIFIFLILLLFIFFNININYCSQHYFYREGLSRTFLIKRWKNSSQLETSDLIEPNSKLLITELHEHHNGPYHLLNATLNVPHSQNSILQGRGADFFIFSKYYCGAESTGYRLTKQYEQGQVELAKAMAISGAAVSPAMGAKTNPILAVFTTLLNMRLNIWMTNPLRPRPPRFIFWLRYYLKELTRQGSEADALVNLSDGAHHENLGIYPLLRRRCRIIIASDAGSDPQFQMEDLANLQRKARIDLGIEIKFKDINKIFPDVNQKERYSQAYFMIGDIHYPDQDAVGKLIYMKTAIIGREPEDLLAYRRKNPDFPDQTTADQFFDEEQFESYRKLGQIIAETTFAQEEKFDTFEKFKSFFLVT